ncbi:lysosomal alpha-mannosidase-like [Colias croceus]|uniref:lysosomal alpha-mannosidase-like n=1 Tax=Colias crocea TaxID=72248 RepID=UPI001E2800C4|nr:lysosomal alpha-mannosidase-like [Colias croceus]
MDPEIVDLLTPFKGLGEACGYDACPTIKEGKLNVHIVPHTHADGDHDVNSPPRPEVVVLRIALPVPGMFHESECAVAVELTKHARSHMVVDRFPFEAECAGWRAVIVGGEGIVRRMVYQLLRQGRLIIVGGSWGMPDEGSTSYQSIIDSYTYTLRKINRTFLNCGRPLVAWQADTFGHSREYASLVAQMGFDGMFINPISFDDELVRMEQVALEFLWRGSDDLGMESDIFTSKLFDGYWSPPGFCFGAMCSDPLLITSDSVFNNIEERVDVFIEQIRYRQSPFYTTNHIMVMMGQMFGYHSAKMWFENIDVLIHSVNEKSYRTGANIHLVYSSPNCYLKAVHSSKPVLKTKQDDFFPYSYDKYSVTSGMFTSRPDLKYFIREGNIYLQVAKQLQVLASLENQDKLLEDFMWIMGVMQDHNIISGALREYGKYYYIKELNDVIQRSIPLLESAFNKLQNSKKTIKYNRCPFNISSCPFTDSSTFHILIYNPLAWTVSVPVRLPTMKEKYMVYDGKGKPIKVYLTPVSQHILKIPLRNTTTDHELLFNAQNIPPLGYKAFYIKKETNKRKRSIIKKLNKNPQKKYYIGQAAEAYNKTYFEEDTSYEDAESDKINHPKFVFTKKQDNFSNSATSVDVANVKNIIDKNNVTPKFLSKSTTDTSIFEETTTDNEISTTELDIESSSSNFKHAEVTRTTMKTIIDDDDDDDKSEENPSTDSYYYVESNDTFIENKYIKIYLDSYKKVSNISLSNGINTSLDIQYFYYVSDDPKKLGTDKRPPGVYIFRPMDLTPVPIIDVIDTKVYKTDLVQEIHSKYSEYASFVLRLYQDNPVVEVDWVIGPVPDDDELGKEVFIRYTTDLENGGVFYTDANGRQTVKRIRNRRAAYQPYNLNKVAGNFYPVTSKIYIEDTKKNIRLSIFNDRSQAGASLLDGTLDLMVQRRLFTDDAGVQNIINDTINGEGVIIRGTHYLYLSKADYKPNRVFEKKLAKEIELRPVVLVSNSMEYDDWLDLSNEFKGLNKKLPIGVHVLGLQEWNDGTILVRLENYLEKSDTVKSGIKNVVLKDLFHNIKMDRVKETTLAANMWLSDWLPLQWEKNGSFFRNFNEYYGSDKEEYSEDVLKAVDVDLKIVKLTPQQIRTFVVWYKKDIS